jgi:hypothetical protein
VNRHGARPEGHLNVMVATIDPYTITEPCSGKSWGRKSIGMQQDQFFSRSSFHAKEETFVFSDGR